MRSMRKSVEKEAAILRRVRDELDRLGFMLVEKTHGNAMQPGWPDLYAYRPQTTSAPDGHGYVRVSDEVHRWVEVKRPGGRLTRAQRVRFQSWEDAGLGVWVVDSEKKLAKILWSEPNWRLWLPKVKK